MGIYLIQSVLVVWAISLRYHSEWLLLLLYVLGSGFVVTGFTLADRSGFRLKHAALAPSPGLLQTPLRDHLIKFSFPVVKYGLPGLLIVTSLLTSDIPGYLAGLSTFLIFLVALTSLLRKDRIKQVLRFSLYLIIPFITYLSQEGMKPWSEDIYHILYTASFLVIFFFVILTIKLTRRKKGFQNTPMDFLILFIALVLPNVCWNLALTQQMGLLTVKILIFFFGFEILMGELRDRVSELAIPTTAALALIAARAFF
jgi:UDP-GlcNAc:undecaprenyl-phosphate/decaprenyl-phosphate GlcNAc-1-phosphate transferase